MIRNKTLLVALLSSSFLFPSISVAAAWSGYLIGIFEELIEQERWHPGGLRRERMLQIYRRAIATEGIEVVARIQDEVVRQARRGYVDLEPYRLLLPAIEKVPREGTSFENSSVSSVLREQANFYGLSRRARREIYRETLQSQREQPESSRRIVVRGDVFWQSWFSAAIAALYEKMDDLLPLIEQGHYVERGHRDGAAESVERQLNAVLLPLARARSSAGWAAQYLSLIRRAFAGDDHREMRSLLVREAALELVAKNRRGVVRQLKAILVSEAHARSGRSDRLPLEEDPAVKAVVGAVRALGDPGFEERLWRRWHPATAEEIDNAPTKALAAGLYSSTVRPR